MEISGDVIRRGLSRQALNDGASILFHAACLTAETTSAIRGHS